MSGYEIARKTDIQISSAYYFLKKMVDTNVVIRFEDGVFGLNPIFFNTKLWNDMIKQFTTIIAQLKTYKYEGFEQPDPEYTLELIADVLFSK